MQDKLEASVRRAGRWSLAGWVRNAAWAAIGIAIGGLQPAFAQPELLSPAGRPDYDNPRTWLCRPDLRDNRCKVDLDATVIAPSGAMTLEKYVPAKDPKIDCFFVYPTVSKDAGWQSDLTPDHMEWDDIRLQFARFGKVCRQFAPMYRQYTVTALRASAGGPQPVGEKPASGVGGYSDVVDAWNWYMAHENGGRGVVLIGHSQGAAMLAKLIAQEIDGKPAQKRLVSALIIGAPVMVPPGRDAGGTFKAVPLCRAEDQTGCVISYSSFRDRIPPPPDSRFGRGRDGMDVACTNPASLKGGAGTPVSYFLAKGLLNDAGGSLGVQWTNPARPISTHFVETPGLISTQCTKAGEFSYLEVRVLPNPHGHRTDELGGYIVRSSGVDPSWGLHMIDVDHSMGTLLHIVDEQGAAYARQAGAQ